MKAKISILDTILRSVIQSICFNAAAIAKLTNRKGVRNGKSLEALRPGVCQ